jgi:hypothetical protein
MRQINVGLPLTCIFLTDGIAQSPKIYRKMITTITVWLTMLKSNETRRFRIWLMPSQIKIIQTRFFFILKFQVSI